MTVTSTIPAAIDALVTMLTVRPALAVPGTLVVDGYPANARSIKQLITIGGQVDATATGTQEFASLGARRRTEDYTIRVYCSAVDADQKKARDAAFALMAEVEDLLRTDPTLGGVTSMYAEAGGDVVLDQSSEDPDTMPSGGRWAAVSFDVHVVNRIGPS